jgi:hypothetical protein
MCNYHTLGRYKSIVVTQSVGGAGFSPTTFGLITTDALVVELSSRLFLDVNIHQLFLVVHNLAFILNSVGLVGFEPTPPCLRGKRTKPLILQTRFA